MQVDVIRAQHERLRAAVAALLSLTAPPAERVTRAAAELEHAFAAGVPVWAERDVATIRALAAGADDTPRPPSDAQLARLSAAFLDLYTVACREYWTA